MYDVYLDVSRRSARVMAHVLEPPGLGVRFADRRAFEGGIGGAIREHLAWLASYGLHPAIEPATFIEWRVAHEGPVDGDFESGDDVGFYGPDAAPMSRQDVERYLAVARAARDELLALARSLPPQAMDWCLEGRSRSVRQILWHVANAELWYITRIIDDPASSGMPPELEALDRRMDACDDPVARLEMVREGFERFFRSAPLERLHRVVTPTWFCNITTEPWTGRKALRRAIEHEREHTRSLLRILKAHGVPTPGRV